MTQLNKNILSCELSKVWNESMTNYCVKTTAHIIEYKNQIYTIDKPRIKTDLCYGYGLNGITNEEEMQAAFRQADKAREDETIFIKENLSEINYIIKSLNSIREEMGRKWVKGDHPRYLIYTRPKYNTQPEDCRLYSYQVIDTFRETPPKGAEVADIRLVDLLIIAYKQVMKDFGERLKKYLARYGTKKLHIWTYLVD